VNGLGGVFSSRSIVSSSRESLGGFVMPDLFDFEKEYLIAFGEAILAWNRADAALKQLLTGLCGGDGIEANLKAGIVVSEMGTRDISYALDSFAENILPEQPAACVKCANDWHGLLSAYRNYYAHNITSVFDIPNVGAAGVILYVTAKGKLVEHQEFVPRQKIEWFSDQCEALRTYISAILHHLFWSGPKFDSPQRPLPHTPVLPPKLEKPRLLIRERFPPPRSSPAKS
jgi:hypothetical protein